MIIDNNTEMPKYFSDVSTAVDEVWTELGKEIRLATPLGLGKPNFFLNELYARAKADPSRKLKFYTALSLTPPHPGTNELAQKFLKPFAERMWGKHYPVLEYSKDAESNRLPKNVSVHEFYFRAGSALGSKGLQSDYQSINYTHVAEAVFNDDIQLIVQMVAKPGETGTSEKSGKLSLGCNPDVTLDLMDLYRESGKKVLRVAVVHPDLPYVGGDAEVAEEFFDFIVDDKSRTHELFALPRIPITEADHAIGFYASQLIPDNGTLQIGIGSLSDAVVCSLLFRDQQNAAYKNIQDVCWKSKPIPKGITCQSERFSEGIYGLSEMVTDAYMHLRRSGILKREVKDETGKSRTYLHGAFFLGSKEFYKWLRSLRGDDYSGIRMTRVSKVNDLYDPNELHLRRQRINARFLNTCMQVTLLGGAASETLENGNVVSGVGGQYNFVSMSHELKGSRSILMLRSTRESHGRRRSNIIESHGHLTIPRHLRDIVITEYGIANLRNQTDEACIRALIEISDSQFQPELLDAARKAGKIASDYEIPDHAKNNTPGHLGRFISHGKSLGTFQPFQLGSDFTPAEENLALALERLKLRTALPGLKGKLGLLGFALSGRKVDKEKFRPELERMTLSTGGTLKEKLYRLLLLAALNES